MNVHLDESLQRKSTYDGMGPGRNTELSSAALVDANENGDEDDLEISAEIRDEMLISKALYNSEVHAEEEKGRGKNKVDLKTFFFKLLSTLLCRA